MIDYKEHLDAADRCVIAFASGGGDFSEGIPHFEFGNTLRGMGVSYVLMRDSTGFSHQYGVTGIGDRYRVCGYIAALGRTYPRLMTIGLSVGALAALMYGQMVPAVTDIIALSPYTSLGGNPESVFGDDWRARCPFDTDVPLMIDLQPLFMEGPHCRVRVYISDGENTSLDRFHAQRIGLTDITLVPGASHAGLGRLMRDTGKLRDVVLE